jgi:hypothetical protein
VLLAWALVTKHQVFDPDFENGPFALLDENCRIYELRGKQDRYKTRVVYVWRACDRDSILFDGNDVNVVLVVSHR